MDLEAIKKRAHELRDAIEDMGGPMTDCPEDVLALVAEVERMEARVNGLGAATSRWKEECGKAERERDEARAEAEAAKLATGTNVAGETWVDRCARLEAEALIDREDIDRQQAKIEAALAEIDKRLERTRSWTDMRTHDERNALRSIREALTGGRE